MYVNMPVNQYVSLARIDVSQYFDKEFLSERGRFFPAGISSSLDKYT